LFGLLFDPEDGSNTSFRESYIPFALRGFPQNVRNLSFCIGAAVKSHKHHVDKIGTLGRRWLDNIKVDLGLVWLRIGTSGERL
jgi:hypothetical protein